MNEEGLEVGRALGEQLASLDGRTSHNGRIVADTGTEDSVVRRLADRAKEVVSNLADLSLTPS